MRQLIAVLGVVGILALFAGVIVLIGYYVSGTGTDRRVGSAASGAVYEMLNQDKRRAVEVIVKERAAATDPETQDDTIPPQPGSSRMNVDGG